MRQPREDSPRDSIQDGILAFRRGEPGAADRLVGELTPSVTRNVVSFLGLDHADVDDVIQDALIETMKYLERDAEFEGDIVRLSITIARNRCRDLMRWRRRHPQADYESLAGWLDDPSSSILEQLEERECRRLLQIALDRLSTSCRALLKALFMDGVSSETMRQELGLGTVHAVYYRRDVCLRKASKFFHNLLSGRSNHDSSAFTTDSGDDRHG